jgi:hypothetical protein
MKPMILPWRFIEIGFVYKNTLVFCTVRDLNLDKKKRERERDLNNEKVQIEKDNMSGVGDLKTTE